MGFIVLGLGSALICVYISFWITFYCGCLYIMLFVCVHWHRYVLYVLRILYLSFVVIVLWFGIFCIRNLVGLFFMLCGGFGCGGVIWGGFRGVLTVSGVIRWLVVINLSFSVLGGWCIVHVSG